MSRVSRFVSSENKYLLPLLAVAGILMIWGTWRFDPVMSFPDERTAIGDSLRMAYTQNPFIDEVSKGGNLHLYVLAVAYLLAVGYWILTGRFGSIVEESGVLLERSVLEAPPLVQTAWYQAAFAGRLASVACGVATVFVVYKLAKELSGERAGLLAGVVLTVSSGFVITVKWATEDALLMLLVVTTLYTVVRATADPSRRNILLVGVSAGLASSAKISAGFLAFPVALLLVRQYTQSEWTVRDLLRNTGIVGGSGLAVYIATTPTTVVFPQTWYNEVIIHYLIGSGSTHPLQLPFPGALFNLGFLSRSVGLPLFILLLIATGWAVYRIATDRGRFVYLLAFLVPYILFMSQGWTAQFFRMVVILPIFAVFIGAFVEMLLSRPDIQQYVKVMVAVVVLFSLVYTAVPVADFNTSRAEATEWTQANVPSDATVDVHSRPLYRPQFAAGTNVTWIEVQSDRPDEQQRAIDRLESGHADYIVLSSSHYRRFFRDPLTFQETTEMYRSLLNNETEYRITSQFGPPIATSETPMTHFRQSFQPGSIPKDGNPTIVVLQHSDS